MNILQSIKKVLAAPFKWGYEVVDTRPTGAAYRRATEQLHAVETGNDGEVAFVVGNGLVEKRPVVMTIQAATPADAANATLKAVHELRRSKAREINRAHKVAVAEHRSASKAAQQAPVEEVTGPLPEPVIPTPTDVGSGVVGSPIMVPA